MIVCHREAGHPKRNPTGIRYTSSDFCGAILLICLLPDSKLSALNSRSKLIDEMSFFIVRW